MYFKSSIRKNPETGDHDGYYRLVESYRDLSGRVCHRTLLNVGFLPGVSVDQLNQVKNNLNDKLTDQQTLFESGDATVSGLSWQLWERLSSEKKLDLQQMDRVVKVDSLKHDNVREIGAEWLGYNTWHRLELGDFLQQQGWGQEQVDLAATQIIARAVHPASELRTSRWVAENSAICELTGYDQEKMTKDKLYGSALRLYGIKDKLERHLSGRTDHLFDLDDKIILYDLTNTYFEGRKVNSKLAQFGRSKEKRSDAKLIVLALVINLEGFIKYSNIHEGNIADNMTLGHMIDKLGGHTCKGHRPTVVLDAGIATQDNLELIKGKGYHYVCVSRTKLKDYRAVEGHQGVSVQTSNKQEVALKAVRAKGQTDYFMEVKSTAKQAKEKAMKTAFEGRFEQTLEKINASLGKKGGTKGRQKVFERIGRAKEKYPSIQSLYKIDAVIDQKKDTVTELKWSKSPAKDTQRQNNLGVYFVRTDLNMTEETALWKIYNAIREVEATFRCLKADLDLRPIYHKNDDSTMAHLHLGILAYWLVNTIRHQLKAQHIHHSWAELVRIANTQKIVISQGQNLFDRTITVKRCSEPTPKLVALYDALKIKHHPFRKKKSVVHKRELKKDKISPSVKNP